MNNSFFSRFAPKETKFFPLLEHQAFILTRAAEALAENMGYYMPSEQAASYKKIKEIEHEGDKLTNVIQDELSKTFITPFDREDIHSIADAVDDVIDCINSSAKRITIYTPQSIPDACNDLAKLIKEDADCILQGTKELGKFKQDPSILRKLCARLHDIESEADDIYEMYTKKLFEEEKDCIELIKKKEIIYELERTTDAAERVGKLFSGLIVKYA